MVFKVENDLTEKDHIILKEHENVFYNKLLKIRYDNRPKFECNHKSHSSYLLKESCIRKQLNKFVKSIETETLTISKNHTISYLNKRKHLTQLIELLRHELIVGIEIKCGKNLEFTCEKCKSYVGKIFKLDTLPKDLPHYECNIYFNSNFIH